MIVAARRDSVALQKIKNIHWFNLLRN